MIKKKYFIICFSFLLVLLLGLSSISLGYTFDDFLTYCRQIVAGDISGASGNWYCKNMAQWVLNNETRIRNATNVNNYSCFVCSADSNGYFCMYGSCGFATAGANYTNCYPTNIVNPKWGCRLFENSIDTSYGSDPISSYTTNITRTFGLVTGTISTQNRGYFNLANLVHPLEFQPHFVNTTTYQNTSVNYTVGNLYIINEIELGTIIPNDAKLYNCYLYDGDIIIGAYTYNFYSNTQLYANALRGSNNKVYCYTRYLDYNKIYNIEIEYYYENSDTLNIAHDNLVIFAPGSTVTSSRCYFFK